MSAYSESMSTDISPEDSASIARELQNLRLKNSMLEEFADNLRQQLQNSEAQLQQSRHDFEEVSQIRDNLRQEICKLNDAQEKLKNEKIEMLDILKNKNEENTSLKILLQTSGSKSKDNDFQNILNKEIKLKFLIEQLNKEKELYSSQIEELTDELKSKTSEILKIRRHHSEKCLEKDIKIDAQTDELNNLKLELNRLKSLLDSKENQNEEISHRLMEVQLNWTKAESSFNRETETQHEIIDILKKDCEDKQKQNNDLNKTVDDLRDLLKKGFDANSELEIQFENMKENYLMSERMNEDDPILYQKALEFESIESFNAEVDEKLKQLMFENEKLLSEKNSDLRTINSMQREINRYQHEVSDLSTQIVALLQSSREEQGFESNEDSFPNDSDIPREIIVFKNIKDLHEKNRQLLAILHEMNRELQEKDSTDYSRNMIDSNLESEIDSLKMKIKNLEEELKSKNDQIKSNRQSKFFDSNLIDSDNINLIAENKELRMKLEKYVEDLEKLREKNLNELRRLESDKNELSQENFSIKNDVFRLTSELNTQKNHLEELAITLEKYQNENATIRERNIRLNNELENLGKNCIQQKEKIEELEESVTEKENRLKLMQADINQSKINVEYLAKENDRLNEDRKIQENLIQSIRLAQENCSRIENEALSKQSLQIEHLKNEIAFQREKFDKEKVRFEETILSLQNRCNNLQDLLDKEREKFLQLQQELFNIKTEMQASKSIDAKISSNQLIVETIDQHQNVPDGSVKKDLQIAQDEIKVLRGKLANSEQKCRSFQELNGSLESSMSRMIEENEKIKNDINEEIKNKTLIIDTLRGDLETLSEKNRILIEENNFSLDRLDKIKSEYEKRLERIQSEYDDLNRALQQSHEHEKDVLNEMRIQSLIANKAQIDRDNAIEMRSKDAQTICELEMKIKESQKNFNEKLDELKKLKQELNSNREIAEKRKELLEQENASLKIRCGVLEKLHDSTFHKIEQLNGQIIALQNNSKLFAMDENQQKENTEQLLSLVKFLRDEKAQLQVNLTKYSDENMCLKIEIENLKKEIEQLKLALQMEKESTERSNQTQMYQELKSKAQLVPILTENNAQLKSQVNQLERKCIELTEKLKQINAKEKQIQDLSNKSIEEEVQKELLKNEIENWKSKSEELSHQLKNTDSDSLKRLMNEKTLLNKQLQANNVEINKLKHEIENKTRSISSIELELVNVKQQLKQSIDQKAILDQEIVRSKNEYSNLMNVNGQLKSLARKYKSEIAKIKSFGENKVEGESNEFSEKETQCDLQEAMAKNDTPSEDKSNELLTKITALDNEIARLNADNESLKQLAGKKEEVAKKIAQQAKQKISDLHLEKSNWMKEKDDLVKETEELRLKVASLEENSRSYVDKLKTEFETQISQHQIELQTANRQIEDLTSQLKQPTVPIETIPMVQLTTCSNVKPPIINSAFTTPVRHSVLPQQQPSTSGTNLVFSSANKPTPTVSIRPMTVSVLPQATVQPRPAISTSSASSFQKLLHKLIRTLIKRKEL
ncbi:hypothetical protein QR98_0035770 [Sarcoptes scabiei]|uniref:Nucleoprotein TPR/MPL1 domain-containing protein n=1 Tax=Sarcoptes scabiei TaxID=52283 RepID=A0A132A249_SARSC|nr:hypothetical protein QR98_0035770 [Sarcoptes scabiei]